MDDGPSTPKSTSVPTRSDELVSGVEEIRDYIVSNDGTGDAVGSARCAVRLDNLPLGNAQLALLLSVSNA